MQEAGFSEHFQHCVVGGRAAWGLVGLTMNFIEGLRVVSGMSAADRASAIERPPSTLPARSTLRPDLRGRKPARSSNRGCSPGTKTPEAAARAASGE